MKKLTIYPLVVLLVYLASCEQSTETIDRMKLDQKAYSTTFPNVPDVVVRDAYRVYGDSLPAVTIAFTYSRGDSLVVLEDDWSYFVDNSSESDCDIGEGTDYYELIYQGREGYAGSLKTIDGFTFLEEDELCGEGTYNIDNRQGGWFDHVCGPISASFVYEGTPVIKLVRLWCE